jgi:hypothetical protein
MDFRLTNDSGVIRAVQICWNLSSWNKEESQNFPGQFFKDTDENMATGVA